MNKLLYLILIAVFLGGDNILNFFGVTPNSFLFGVAIVSVILLISKSNNSLKFKELLLLVIFVFAYSMFKIFTNSGGGTRMIGFIVLMPFLALYCFSICENCNSTLFLFRLIEISFLILASTLIAERIFHTNFFPVIFNNEIIMDTSEMDFMEFRSVGFFGHSLQNALIMVAYALYFVSSKLYSTSKKILYAFISLACVACCNSRSAIVFLAVILTIYLFRIVFSSKVKMFTKVLFVTGFILFGWFAFRSISAGLIGGRLIDLGLVDDNSAMARFSVFRIFNTISFEKLAVGLDLDEANRVLSASALSHVENFWILWILRYGYLFVFPLIFMSYSVLRKIGKRIGSFENIIMLSFLIQASTNNSLAVCYNPLAIFLLCYYMLSVEDRLSLNNIPNKYTI